MQMQEGPNVLFVRCGIVTHVDIMQTKCITYVIS